MRLRDLFRSRAATPPTSAQPEALQAFRAGSAAPDTPAGPADGLDHAHPRMFP
jgi:hypothetical protein